jgi:hypothetical protein
MGNQSERSPGGGGGLPGFTVILQLNEFMYCTVESDVIIICIYVS